MTAGQVVTFIIGTIIVVFGAYYMTYFIGNRSMKAQGGRTIRVLDRTALSKDKMICILEIHGKVYIVAMSDGGVSLIDSMDVAEYVSAEEEQKAADYSPEDMNAVQSLIFSGFASVKNSRIFKDRNAPKDGGAGFKSWRGGGKTDDDTDNFADFVVDDEPELSFAKEEDSIDEVYRRIQSRKRRGGSGGNDSPPDGGGRI